MILDLSIDDRNLAPFLELPERVYAGDPYYRAEPPALVLHSLNRPRFRGRQRTFLAWDQGRCVARAVARVSPTLRDEAGRAYGMIGFFEALPHPAPVREMLAQAVAWLRGRGAGTIIGPIDGDTWHGYRLNVGPFDRPPFLFEPYHKPYYAALWEEAGFAPWQGYYSQHIADMAGAAAALERVLARCERSGYRIRPLDLERFDEELRLWYDLSRRCFAEAFLYDDISLEEFRALYAGVKQLLDPELALFAHAPSGEAVGFLFALVDRPPSECGMRNAECGMRNPSSAIRTPQSALPLDTINIKTLAVLPGRRQGGLGAALTCFAHRQALQKGLRHANHCLIREGNPSGRLDGGLGVISRRYVLYRYERSQ